MRPGRIAPRSPGDKRCYDLRVNVLELRWMSTVVTLNGRIERREERHPHRFCFLFATGLLQVPNDAVPRVRGSVLPSGECVQGSEAATDLDEQGSGPIPEGPTLVAQPGTRRRSRPLRPAESSLYRGFRQLD